MSLQALVLEKEEEPEILKVPGLYKESPKRSPKAWVEITMPPKVQRKKFSKIESAFENRCCLVRNPLSVLASTKQMGWDLVGRKGRDSVWLPPLSS